MKHLSALLIALSLAACGAKSGSTSASDAASCGPKSVFSVWSDDGGGQLDLSPISFGGQMQIEETLEGVQCIAMASATGDQCQGTITISGANNVPEPGLLTTICQGYNGTYDYYRYQGNLVFGKQGSVPIEYH
jgi:hypothetical protein